MADVQDAPGAASSAPNAQLPHGLLSVQEILAHTRYRADHRETLQVESAADLGIHYQDRGNGTSGFYAAVPVTNADGSVRMKELPLSHGAVMTACWTMPGRPSIETFAAADDPSAFPKFFQNVMDSQKRKQHGMLVRHDGLQINAVLPPNYVVKDSADLLEEFIPALRDNVGDIVGVLGLEQGYGDIASYRIVMGNNIMQGIEPDKGQYLMFNINTSETGLIDTKTSLGLYRTFCTNSAIRTQTLSRWDHRTPFSPFYDKSARVIRESGYLQESYSKIFAELLGTPLPFPALDLIHAFRREQLITRGHAEVALIHAESSASETQYDLFNIMTRSAQDLPTISARELAEEASMKLFTEPGGVLAALQRAENRTRRGGPAQPQLEN
jgi:hypothetical protein